MDLFIQHKKLSQPEIAALSEVIFNAPNSGRRIGFLFEGVFIVLLFGGIFHAGVNFLIPAVVTGGIYYLVFRKIFHPSRPQKIAVTGELLRRRPGIAQESLIHCTEEGISATLPECYSFIRYEGIPLAYLVPVPETGDMLLYLPTGCLLRRSAFPDEESFNSFLTRFRKLKRI